MQNAKMDEIFWFIIGHGYGGLIFKIVLKIRIFVILQLFILKFPVNLATFRQHHPNFVYPKLILHNRSHANTYLALRASWRSFGHTHASFEVLLEWPRDGLLAPPPVEAELRPNPGPLRSLVLLPNKISYWKRTYIRTYGWVTPVTQTRVSLTLASRSHCYFRIF